MESKTIEQLEKELATAKEENKLLQGVNNELSAEIQSGKTAPADVLPGCVSKESFEVNKVTYGFAMHGVNHGGKVIEIADVLKDQKLQAELVKMQSGFIAEIAR